MLNHIKQTTLNATRHDDRIPASAWIGGAIFLAAVFGFVPLLAWIYGVI